MLPGELVTMRRRIRAGRCGESLAPGRVIDRRYRALCRMPAVWQRSARSLLGDPFGRPDDSCVAGPVVEQT